MLIHNYLELGKIRVSKVHRKLRSSVNRSRIRPQCINSTNYTQPSLRYVWVITFSLWWKRRTNITSCYHTFNAKHIGKKLGISSRFYGLVSNCTLFTWYNKSPFCIYASFPNRYLKIAWIIILKMSCNYMYMLLNRA